MILRDQWIKPIFQFLVPSWSKLWTGQQLIFRLVNNFQNAISVNARQYGIHGLRLGGACPATAFGILDRIIMCHIG